MSLGRAKKKQKTHNTKLINSLNSCEGLILPTHGLIICAQIASDAPAAKIKTKIAILPFLPQKTAR